MSTHYEILRIPLDATAEVVKARYRMLASKYHPDRYNNGTEMFKRIQLAFEELSSARRRRRYDDMLRRQKRIPAKDPCWFCHKSGADLGYDKTTGSRVHLQCIRDALKQGDPIAELMQYLLQEHEEKIRPRRKLCGITDGDDDAHIQCIHDSIKRGDQKAERMHDLLPECEEQIRPRCRFCNKTDGEIVEDIELLEGYAHIQCIRDGIERGGKAARSMSYLVEEHELTLRRTRPLNGRFHSYWTWPSKRERRTADEDLGKAIPHDACIGVVRLSGLHNYLVWDGTKFDLRKYEITFSNGDTQDFSHRLSIQFPGGQLYNIGSYFYVRLDSGQHWTYWRTGDDLWFEFPDQVCWLC